MDQKRNCAFLPFAPLVVFLAILLLPAWAFAAESQGEGPPPGKAAEESVKSAGEAEGVSDPEATEEETTEGAEAESVPAAQSGGSIGDRWGQILGGSAIAPQPNARKPSAVRLVQPDRGFQELREQFFYRFSIDYRHNWVSFTGEPTATFLGNSGPAFTSNPDGTINYPPSFQNNDDKFYTSLSFGTRGYGSDRLNTYVAVLGQFDIDKNTDGSPFLGYLDSFGGQSRVAFLNGWFELDGLAEDGFFADMKLRGGRQYTHSLTRALPPLGAGVMDGAAIKYDAGSGIFFGGFVGSRPAIWSRPDNRFISGFNVGFNMFDKAVASYDFVNYSGTWAHMINIETQLEIPLFARFWFRMVESRAVEVGLQGQWVARDWSVRSMYRKILSDRADFDYDIYQASPAHNDFNRVPRLYLTPTSKSTAFTLDAQRNMGVPWLWFGARVAAFRLDEPEEETNGFEAPFTDWSAYMLLNPGSWEFMADYRYRNIDRGNPTLEIAEHFDDISTAGETRYSEVQGSVGYRIHHRLQARVGTYWRSFNLQNRLTTVSGSQTNGYFGNLLWKLYPGVDFRLRYGADNDYRLFTPDIDWQKSLSVGLDFYK